MLLEPNAYHQAIVDRHPSRDVERAERWLKTFPVNRTGIVGAHPGIMPLEDIWLEFALALSQPNVREDGLRLIVADPSHQDDVSRPAQRQWEAWERLGLVDPNGGLNFDSSPSQVAQHFLEETELSDTAFQAILSDAPERHWQGAFWTTKDFASAVMSGRLPFDDLHALFFHAADLVDPIQKKYFLWVTQFLELESLHQMIVAKAAKPTTLSFGEEIFHHLFEGTSWAHRQSLGGYIQLANLRIRGTSPRQVWTPQDFEAALAQGPQAIVDYVRRVGPPPIREDLSHYRHLAPALVIVATYFNESLGTRSHHHYIRGVRYKFRFQDFLTTTRKLFQSQE